MKKLFFLTLFVVGAVAPFAARSQGKFYTKSGKISFFSTTSLEDIEAVNKTVVVLLNSNSGEIQFAALIKGFEFRKALMQEHFNGSDYLESNKFPRSEFKGTITNNAAINYNVNGEYAATVKGKLTIHGVSRDIESSGKLTVRDGKITVNAVFAVLIADYKITPPRMQRDNIAKSIKVTVDCALSPL